jgi:Sulfotransferase family
VKNMGDAVQSAGAWPDGLGILDTAAAKQMQNDYLQGARARQRANTRWTFDKSLHVWKWLPAVAAVLPGAVCFHIVRDPRDCAISLLLSNFHPKSYGWTSSLHDIQRVMAAERALAPLALATLGMPHETIVYENLVDDPRAHMQRATERLGVAMQDSVLAPQGNTRTVLTLSHEQVRKPINKSSIGRWKNYEFAFDDSWRALASAHDARRTH